MALAPKVASIEIEDEPVDPDEPVEPVEPFTDQFAVAFSAGKVDFTVNAKLGITRS